MNATAEASRTPDTKCWLWPDHTIGKCESRELREKHNRVLNDLMKLVEATKMGGGKRKGCDTLAGCLRVLADDLHRGIDDSESGGAGGWMTDLARFADRLDAALAPFTPDTD